jgi:hypothetical protein
MFKEYSVCINAGLTWRIVVSSIPFTGCIIALKDTFTPTIVDGYIEIVRIKATGKRPLKCVVVFISVWCK